MAKAKSFPLQTVMGVFLFCEAVLAAYALQYAHHRTIWFVSLIAAIPIFAAVAGNLLSADSADEPSSRS